MKILYLYNKKDWALHNVGKLWFSSVPRSIAIDMDDYHKIGEKDFAKYDFVWFSLYIYEKFNYEPNKSIVTIHDPIELFPQKSDWKSYKIDQSKIKLLKQLKNLNVTSVEIRQILKHYGISVQQIPTTSLLFYRDCSDIKSTTKCDLLSIANEYPRKNISLINEIRKKLSPNKIIFDVKLGDLVLPETDYINILDSHEIYICTSFQEGGPLPAMDAMARGLVVITTPVGQIQELITDGHNGYICNTKEEFLQKIITLCKDKRLLHTMRLKSLSTLKEFRGPKSIHKTINTFLTRLNY